MINFSYGSNMLERRLRERAPSARAIATGILRGHTLRWHKVGRDDSGKCDAFATGDDKDVVHGVLYEIAPEDKPALDAAEGLGAGYDEKEVKIHTASGVVRAHLYCATHIDPEMVPFDWYQAIVVQGARQHGLPAEYVARLEAQPSMGDPDPARSLRNRQLLEPSMTRQLISSGSTFEEQIGYSRAVVDREWVFVSGTTGFAYATMTLAEGVVAQAEQCFRNIDAALRQAGSSLEDVVRVTYILPDATEFPACWPVMRRYLGAVRPAATMISAGLVDPRMRIEIEVTARKRSWS
jgi:enamine deaminase RidA (YjgF/YER057c/UK114 family)